MQNAELLSFLLVAGVTSSLLILAARGRRSLTIVLSLVPAFCLAAAVVWSPPDAEQQELAKERPSLRKDDEFVTSSACRSCHPSQYNSWHHSFHRTMTQVASPNSILAPFDGRELVTHGVTCSVDRLGDIYFVEMADPDWEAAAFPDGIPRGLVTDAPRIRLPVVMTTGSHHLQAYWVPSEHGNKIRIFPWVYHIGLQRWLPNEDSFISPPDIKHYPQVWNNSCIQCHSVGGEDGYEPGNWQSSVAELGISCEACHGPGEQHIQHYSNPVTRYAVRNARERDPTIVNPAKLSAQQSSQVCGQCHTAFAPDSSTPRNTYRPGGEFDKLFTLADPHSTSTFWPDGTMRIGGREYSGMLESECYQHGEMSCLTCHSMHASDPNKQMRVDLQTDEACTQCHQEVARDITAHTHHQLDSEGSRCYNCHMPRTSYALFSAIRSHRIDSPNVKMSVEGGRPNACNQCHLDQTLAWTDDYLSKWYGIASVELSEDERTIAASLLWLLRGDAVQRVLAAWTFAWEPAKTASGAQWQTPFLIELLDDSYTMVRYMAARALKSYGVDLGEYDFVVPPTQRSPAAPEMHLRHAQSTAVDPTSYTEAVRVFFDSQGVFSRGLLERLLSQRDNTPITLNE
ncbi:MAG: cytochrome c3 family protein [Pirellulaceae bacterium]